MGIFNLGLRIETIGKCIGVLVIIFGFFGVIYFRTFEGVSLFFMPIIVAISAQIYSHDIGKVEK